MDAHAPQTLVPGDFVFLTSTSGGKSKEARSHIVQRLRRHKEARTQIERSRRPKPQTLSKTELDRFQDNTISVRDTSMQDLNNNRNFAKDESQIPADPWRYNDQEPHAIARIGVLPEHVVLGPDRAIQSGSPDPFSSTAVAIDTTMIDLLYFSRQLYRDSKWSLGGSLRKYSHSTEAWTVDMRHAICSEAALYAALAVACHYAARPCRKPSSSAPHLKGLQYKISSLNSVQKNIENKSTNPYLVQAVLDLAGAELFTTNFAAGWLHLQAAKIIIDSMGGLAKMSESTRDSAGLADSVLSRVLLRRPVFRIEDWDPGPWEAQRPNMQHYTELLPVFRASKMQQTGVFDLELPTVFLRAAFSKLRTTLAVRKWAVSMDESQYSNRTLRWVHIRTAAIYTGLFNHYLDSASLSPTCETLHRKAEGQVAAATCLAARYCHSLITYTPSVVLNHIPAQKVYEELNHALHGLEQAMIHRENLSLWLCFVSAVAEELDGKRFFAEHEGSQKVQFRAMTNTLGLVSKKEISNILSCFIYDESLDVYLDGYLKEDHLGF